MSPEKLEEEIRKNSEHRIADVERSKSMEKSLVSLLKETTKTRKAIEKLTTQDYRNQDKISNLEKNYDEAKLDLESLKNYKPWLAAIKWLVLAVAGSIAGSAWNIFYN